jgi:hypothetical protein
MKFPKIILNTCLVSAIAIFNTVSAEDDSKSEILKSSGATIVKLKPGSMGLPKDKLPGAKFISFSEWEKMKNIPKTGLFLVDTQSIPPELPAQLKEEGYELSKDGKLTTKDKKPVAIFIKPDYFSVAPSKDEKSATGLLNNLFNNAYAGNPYPFRCFSVSPWSIYHGGFCRDYQAKTTAHAYGVDRSNNCSSSSPHTRIEYIETRASIGGRSDRDSCRNCDQESSSVEWDIGCWWPAHGRASGRHFLNMKDGGIELTREFSWRH